MEQNTTIPVDLEGFRSSMRAAGVEEVVDLTLEVYLEEAPRLFDELSEAAGIGDLEQVRARSHSLKSSCANIWATHLSSLFSEMEEAAGDLDTGVVDATLALLRPEFERVMSYLGEVSQA